MAEQLSSPPCDVFNVVTWNILLDKTKTKKGLIDPQADRIESQAETLANLGIDLDVVLIQEAERTPEGHNGEMLARLLGFEASYWFEHNRSKRKGEHIGIFGNRVENAESFGVGHDKKAVITMIGDVAVVGIHHRNESKGPMRTEQMGAVIERVADIEKVIVAGDSNARPLEESRKLLRGEDFRSVFHMRRQLRPTTYPTPAYRHIMRRPLHNLYRPFGTSYDDIEARGVKVLAAGVFEGDSDHYGLAATVVS